MKLAPIGEYQNAWVELEYLIRRIVGKPKDEFIYFPPLIEEAQKTGALEYQICTEIMVHYTYYLTKKEPDKTRLQELKNLVTLFKNYKADYFEVRHHRSA